MGRTSTEVKRRYNEKTYTTWRAPLRKEDYEAIERLRGDLSRAQFLKILAERYAKDIGQEG